MARNLRVLNLSRKNIRLGKTNVKPAVGNPTPTVIDVEDGNVRRDLARYADRVVLLGAEAGIQTAVVPLAAGAAAGGVLSWANPTGKRIQVLRLDLDITTQSSGASTIDAGPAANGTTLNDTLIDGVSGAAVAYKSSADATDKGTNGVGVKGVMVGASGFITASQASGAVAGLAGNALIQYVVAA